LLIRSEEADDVLELFLSALESHPTLEKLTLCSFRFPAAARDALLRVIVLDSPTLISLHLHELRDDEVSLSALADALQLNRHLQDLHVSFEEALAPIASAYEEHLLPAVLACTSLRKLSIQVLVEEVGYEPIPDAAGVVQLVADREAARLAAELAKEPGRSAWQG